MVSSIVMVWTAETELPQASVAVQVRMMVKDWGHAPGTMRSEEEIMGVLQLSVAVAVPVAAGSVGVLHCTW